METDADRFSFDPVLSKLPKSNEQKQPSTDISYEGCRLALLYKGVSLHVRNVRFAEDGCLVGEVSDFSNICSTAYEGVRLGQRISFRDYHVHQRIDD